MDFLTAPLNFDKHTFRCSSLGLLMTEPQDGSNADKYLAKKKRLDDENAKFLQDITNATAKRDAIKNIETKGWKEANDRIEAIKQKSNVKIRELTSEVATLEAVKDEINLSATCISHLIDIYVFALSGREQEIYSKYMDKGKKQEGSGIRILREVDDRFYSKNLDRIFNEWINGECDIDFEDDDVIIDTKLSWDFYSYQPKTIQPIDKNYYWQSQGYMELWNRNNFVLCYVLDDTPDGIIEDEKRRLLYQIGTHMKDTELYAEACTAIEKAMKYSDIPLKFRVIKKPIKRNKADMQRCYARIAECRRWLNKYAQDEWDRINNIGIIPILPDVINIVEPAVARDITVNIGFTITEDNIVLPVSEDPKCPQCDSVNLEFNGDDFECAECGYDSKADGGKLEANELHTHDKITMPLAAEIAGAEPIAIISEQKLPEVNLNTEIPKEEPIQSDELSVFIAKINNCISEQDTITLYKELKPYFEKYANLKDMLHVKKLSFKTVEEIPAEKPTEKKETKPKQSTVEVSESTIREQTLLCKTSVEVKKLYKANREFVDTNIELRNFMQEHGEKLDG